MTGTKREQIEIVTSNERRRRWAPAEKRLIVQETYEPGVIVSLVARRHGIPPSQSLSSLRKTRKSSPLFRKMSRNTGSSKQLVL
ncbi:MAG: hypothetical protein EBZ78_09620 [Verrucomicrobia bacterium]|nr:hypothetical protein [Verrucomicrobiota bacterium]